MSSVLKESKALLEVRAWKTECARDVAGLDPRAAVRKRLRDSADTARRHGFLIQAATRHPPGLVAERKATYGQQTEKPGDGKTP